MELHSSDVDNYDLVVNEIGAYEGTRMVNIVEDALVGPVPGKQYLDVTATGSWTIIIEQQDVVSPDTIPVEYTGTGDDVSGPFYADGELLFEFTHDGEDDIIVRLYGDDGTDVGNLANVQGVKRDSYTLNFDGYGFNPDAGNYWIAVIADGDWTVTISAD